MPPAWLHSHGTVRGDELLRDRALRSTLERLVDFDRINAGEMRLSVGAVNVRSGNFVYFDYDHPQDPPRARDGERRRCRPAFPQSRSTASITGTAA